MTTIAFTLGLIWAMIFLMVVCGFVHDSLLQYYRGSMSHGVLEKNLRAAIFISVAILITLFITVAPWK